MAANPQEPWFNENRQQLLSDLLRNSRPSALAENAATLGTSLVAQAGTGLGTLAGMARSKLKGEPINQEAAAEGIGENVERFTYQPRTEGGKELQRGLGEVLTPLDTGMQAVGQGAANLTGSPAVGAGVYTALNVLDPQMLAPGAIKAAALRGAGRMATEAAKTAVPMSEALRNVPKGQRGAYTLEDLAAVEGEYEFRSPTLEAFGKLKKQEQRVPGKQLLKALQREGAKPDELKWAGLDKLLDTDEVVDAAEVRAIADANVPQIGFETKGGRPEPEIPDPNEPPVPRWVNPYEGKQSLDDLMEADSDIEEAFNEAVQERVNEDSDLEYPETYTVYRGGGRNRDVLETFDNERDAERYIEQYKDDQVESETEYYLENIDEYFDEDQLAEMTEGQKQSWAEENARQSVEDSDELKIESETDYDSEPTNRDEIEAYWEREIRSDPENYLNLPEGVELAPPREVQQREERRWYQNQGIDPDTMMRTSPRREVPDYGEYTVGGNRSEGRDVLGGRGENYGVTLANVLREGRYGRGQNVQEMMGDLSVSGTPLASREAARISEREALPDIEAARGPYASRGSHYGENILHTRETDRPAPSWGTTQVDAFGNPLPMRLVEEMQSDPYQRGRKIGFIEPEKISELRTNEKARVEAFQRESMSGLPMILSEPAIDELVQAALKEKPAGAVAGGLQRWKELKEANAPLDQQVEAAANFFRELYYYAPGGHPGESRAMEVRQSLENLPTMSESPFDKQIPQGPFMETDQYTALAVRDALRRAIRQGQQYIAFTPGEVHARRYGSDSLQWGPGSHPGERVYTTMSYGSEGRGPINERVKQLKEGTKDIYGETINLEDPDAVDQMQKIVRQNLDYGMHEYPDPDVQRRKRAEALVKTLREKPSGDYTPREFGFSDVYDRRVKKQLQAALREAGSKAQIREIEGQFGVPTFEHIDPNTGERTYETVTSKSQFEDLLKESQENPEMVKYHPPVLYAIEADPALAKHAKRGFLLPH